MTGKIISLPPQKSFGFIEIEGKKQGDKDLFFHMNDVTGVPFNELKTEDMVEFDLTDTERGPAAKNVKKV